MGTQKANLILKNLIMCQDFTTEKSFMYFSVNIINLSSLFY